jgi:predicted nucleotidyltransferase component of viral defense system
MDVLRKHEIFEIEVLEKLNSAKLLDALVFGGGTMLRLCYELNRYSVDLDFWFIRKVDPENFFNKTQKALAENYEITDAEIKFYTILLELRSKAYPKRLKIEIRKEIKECDYQERIAYSRSSNIQVVLRAHTLEQTMKNKVEALLERREVRDGFDIEFLLRKGIPLPQMDAAKAAEMKKVLDSFKENDFKVKLGSIVESDVRKYYASNGFIYLKGILR